MVWPLLIEAAFIGVGGAFSIVDWFNADRMAESTSQYQAYLDLIANQTTFYDFIGQAWPSLIFVAGVLLIGFTIATPKRKKGGY